MVSRTRAATQKMPLRFQQQLRLIQKPQILDTVCCTAAYRQLREDRRQKLLLLFARVFQRRTTAGNAGQI